jgi:hypothetical protein
MGVAVKRLGASAPQLLPLMPNCRHVDAVQRTASLGQEQKFAVDAIFRR